MEAEQIRKVACIGSGLIGASWATYFILKGLDVNLYDVKEEYLTAGKTRVDKNLEFFEEKGIIDAEKRKEVASRIHLTTKMGEAVREALFIQESGPEKYEIKRQILKEVEKDAPAEAIFASSTSGLLITEIAKEAGHPERCLGAHPYNPPHLIPLVEMTKGDKTSPEALSCAYTFYKKIGKEPVVLQKEALGFISNRLQTVLYREMVDLVMRGVCSVEDADKALLYGPGLRYGIMGPNLIFQLGGGSQGIKGMMENLVGPSSALWLPDTAKWEKMPPEWADIAQAGVDAEMKNRSPEQGRTNEEIIRFRDEMLIQLLKLHGKF